MLAGPESGIWVRDTAKDCAPASDAELHLSPLNSLIGHNEEKLGQCKSASRGIPLWSTLSLGYSDT